MGKDVGEVHATDEEIAQLCYEDGAVQEKIEKLCQCLLSGSHYRLGVTQLEREVERELCIEIT